MCKINLHSTKMQDLRLKDYSFDKLLPSFLKNKSENQHKNYKADTKRGQYARCY